MSGPRRLPGETSTHRQAAGSRMESTSGTCPKNNGEAHVFRYGKCRFCGKAEGTTHAYQGGECAKGGRHIFHFGKCSKCGVAENHLVSAAAKELLKDGAAGAPGDATAETPAMAAARASRLVSARGGRRRRARRLCRGAAQPRRPRVARAAALRAERRRDRQALPRDPEAAAGGGRRPPCGPTALEALADGLPAPKAAVVGAAAPGGEGRGPEMRRKCPHCDHAWIDVYRKDEARAASAASRRVRRRPAPTSMAVRRCEYRESPRAAERIAERVVWLRARGWCRVAPPARRRSPSVGRRHGASRPRGKLDGADRRRGSSVCRARSAAQRAEKKATPSAWCTKWPLRS